MVYRESHSPDTTSWLAFVPLTSVTQWSFLSSLFLKKGMCSCGLQSIFVDKYKCLLHHFEFEFSHNIELVSIEITTVPMISNHTLFYLLSFSCILCCLVNIYLSACVQPLTLSSLNAAKNRNMCEVCDSISSFCFLIDQSWLDKWSTVHDILLSKVLLCF